MRLLPGLVFPLPSTVSSVQCQLAELLVSALRQSPSSGLHMRAVFLGTKKVHKR